MITLEQRKYNFIEKYIRLKNLKTIEKLEQVIDESVNYEENILSDEVKNAINEGLNSLAKGEGIIHEEAISCLTKKYPSLRL
jgi:hypothetical protein